MEWRPIKSAPRDADVIVGWDCASVWVVRNAHWSDGERWEEQGFDSQEEARGWWSYDNSVGQSGIDPTHWLCVCPDPPSMTDRPYTVTEDRL